MEVRNTILDQRIPKIIHYCWLSTDPFPKDIAAFVASWKKLLPDYEFMLWDLKRDHVGENRWVRQSFEAKKYAFAADYIRIYALHQYGGIYLDTDVEVLKKFDDLLHLPYFAGTEGGKWIEAAILGSIKDADWLKDILFYFDQPFVNTDGSFAMITLPQVMNRYIEKKRKIVVAEKEEILQNISRNYNSHFYIFEKDFFSPKDMGTGVISKTTNTYAIHHFAMSWIPATEKFIPNLKRAMIKLFGVHTINAIIRLIKK
ncbi:glycosyltransferase family 32 protein [Kaistella jeonii]|uniref:Glycosyl transferase n=1 Tax=Kaistella jeonii TaxID=266749 RepID=A0A0C1FKQ4_9FLAO|nr:glycosyltransferase [Kaistella jeonii]KIA88519.1 glycosyl transferase [Kaistella jeonii]SFC19771.1 Glycosyltransferase sugar-binding region containing DXD motif-containing protein [Kaistella jeonii]VEI97018.1 Mannosyltransferase OCH1 and related enzymes [Kaistella jeonii]